MKKIAFAAVVMLSATIAMGQAKIESWPQMKTFHEVMSQTFHPSENGDLAPIKKRSAELLEDANKLTSEALPAAYDNAQIKGAISQLQKEALALDKMVAVNVGDDAIKKQLARVHNAFHQVVGLCRKD